MSPIAELLACSAYLLLGVATATWARERARKRDEARYRRLVDKAADDGMIHSRTFEAVMGLFVVVCWPAFLALYVQGKIAAARKARSR